MSLKRQYRIHFVIGLLAYMVLVPVSLLLLRQIESSGLRVLVALLPVLPALFMVFAFLRYLQGLDELRQRIQLEAFGFSLGMTGLVTFTLAFLENAGGPEVGMIWVLPMIIIFWGIGQIIAGRRYQ